MFCLDEKYSTTRCVTKEKPQIINRPEDKFETLLFLPPGEGRKGEGGLRTKGYFKKSYEDKPLISVITVVLNGEKYLEETILSVLSQTYDNVEYIIIDGGSTDGTLDIIKKYEHAIDYWVSEKDKGIYDAMNKGINVASGEWLNFMNAGDRFAENNILKLIYFEYFQNNSHVDFIYSDTILDGKNFCECSITNYKIIHQSVIYKRKIHNEVGPYIVMRNFYLSDYLFFLICRDKVWRKTKNIISVYDTHGVSYKFIKQHITQKQSIDIMFNITSFHQGYFFYLLYPTYRKIKLLLNKIFKN